VTRTRAAALLLAVAVAGCGGGGPLELVSAKPPAGAHDSGATQGGTGKDSREHLYELRPAEGSELSYEITVRNTGSKTVTVKGVAADEERDGPFVPGRVDGAPVDVAPGATAPVTVSGKVSGCDFGGQQVPLAGPELTYEGGGTQQFDLGIRVELVTERC
jgi:predicted small lipoprotein YifL